MKGKSLCKKIFGLLALGVLFSPFVGNQIMSSQRVYATGVPFVAPAATPTAEDKKETMIENINEILDNLLKIIYILLWPLLFVAGLALDNSLVYGSIFHLDVPLWKFWNMMKNFANFALGFMVLFSILKSIFGGYLGGGGNDKRSPQKIIKSTLVAGILIQSSWFLFGAIIDISTIATYAVGGLPLTLMKGTTAGDNPVVGNSCTMNLSEYTSASIKDLKKMECYCTYGNKKISQCRYEAIGQEFYIIGRKQIGAGFQPGYCCSAGGLIQKINEFPDLLDDAVKNDPNQYDTVLKGILNSALAYQDAWKECRYIRKAFGIVPDGNKCAESITAINDPNVVGKWKTPTPNVGEDFTFQTKGDPFFADVVGGLTVSSILESSKGFVGPMVTIYSSLMDFASISDTDNANLNWGKSLSFFIKVGFAIMLFFPLVALALVLLARIAYLWLAIAFSPILVVKEVFFKDVKMEKTFEHLSLSNLIKLVFAPVFVVFALSISLIFMSTLQSMKTEGVSGNQLLQSMEITPNPKNERSFSFFGLFEFEYEGELVDKGLDNFSWLIVNLFGIGMLWFLLFRAIKQNKLGESIGGAIQKAGQGIFGTIPIVPVAGGIGLTAAKESMSGLQTRMGSVPTKQQEAMQEAFPWVYGGNRQQLPEATSGGFTSEQAKSILEKMEKGTEYEKAASTTVKFAEGQTATTLGQQSAGAFTTAIEGQINSLPEAEREKKFQEILGRFSDETLRKQIEEYTAYRRERLEDNKLKDSYVTDLEQSANKKDAFALDLVKSLGDSFESTTGNKYTIKYENDKYSFEKKTTT